MTDRLQQRFQAILGDRYRIERELARGGMSTVYLARDSKHDRKVAIKLLQPELTTAMTAERFLREIRITAQLQHPHVLSLLDSGAAEGLCYYVMPHVEGESLRERLMWDRQMPVGTAVRIARQVAEALAHAHERGIIHRDIKPENILLLSGHAMVADFGLARAISEAGGSGLTAAGMPIGTPAYMSPEQAIGATDVDGRADQYSLGCVLFEMLTGRQPFTGGSVQTVINRHLEEPPPPICEFRPAVPPALERVVHRLLGKAPRDRYPDIEAVCEALTVIAAEEALDRATPSQGRSQDPDFDLDADSPLGYTPPVFRTMLVTLGIVAAATLAIVAAVRFGGRSGEATPGAAAAPAASGFLTSVAAMPLVPLGNDSLTMALGAGITEEVIAQLARIRNLKVISRTSVTALAGQGLTISQIADTLGVRHVLEGSIQRDGEAVRVTLQLVDAVNDSHVWSDSYTRPAGSIIGLREEIAARVAAALAAAVPGIEAPRRRTGTRNEAALDAASRGMHELERSSPEALARAAAAFEEALRLDPRYADAAAELADVRALEVHLGYGEGDPFARYGEALRMAQIAVAVDETSAQAWYVRGRLRAFAWHPVEEALADLERAVALAPNAGDIRIGLGVVLARAGRYPEALAASRAGAELDPLSPVARAGGYGLTALGARRYDIALREATRALRLDPDFGAGRVVIAAAELLAGRPALCVAQPLPTAPALRAICLAEAGDPRRGAALADSASQAYLGGSGTPYDLGFLASWHARRGEVQAAIEWLDRAHERSPVGLDFRFIDSGLFDRIADDPAFLPALERMREQVRQKVTGSVSGER